MHHRKVQVKLNELMRQLFSSLQEAGMSDMSTGLLQTCTR